MLEKQASQQSAKKRKRYTNFFDTNRTEIGRYAADYELLRVLLKIEGGAKIGNCSFTKIGLQIT